MEEESRWVLAHIVNIIFSYGPMNALAADNDLQFQLFNSQSCCSSPFPRKQKTCFFFLSTFYKIHIVQLFLPFQSHYNSVESKSRNIYTSQSLALLGVKVPDSHSVAVRLWVSYSKSIPTLSGSVTEVSYIWYISLLEITILGNLSIN